MEENKEVKKEKVEEKVKSEKKETKVEKDVKQNEEIKKDDTTFRRVEMPNKNKKEKKKHRVLKTILVIIGILVIAYLVFAIRNFYILKDILVKAGAYENIGDYLYETKIMDNGNQTEFLYTRKNNEARVDIENKSTPENSLIIWKNYNDNEAIVVFEGRNKAIETEADKTIDMVANFPFQFSQLHEGMSGLGLFSLIYSQEYNGKECYVLQIALDYKIWVEKDTGLVVKQESDENYVIECTNIEVNNIPEIDEPDLTGYDIQNNK